MTSTHYVKELCPVILHNGATAGKTDLSSVARMGEVEALAWKDSRLPTAMFGHRILTLIHLYVQVQHFMHNSFGGIPSSPGERKTDRPQLTTDN